MSHESSNGPRISGIVALRELRRALIDVAADVGTLAAMWPSLGAEPRRQRLEILDELVDLVPRVWRKFRDTLSLE